jgi:hypothetical protein
VLLIFVLFVFWSFVLGFTTLVMTRSYCPSSISAIANNSLDAIAERFTKWSRHPYLCCGSLIVFIIVARLALLPVLPIPLPGVHDEFSYLLGADTFASGRWTNPTPKLWEFFETEHVLVKPTYMSKYPPGQACVLAFGMFLSNAWYGVLASFALMCASIYWMARGYLPAKWALLTGLLPLVQPGLSSYWLNSYWGGCLSATGAALVYGACARLSTKLSTIAACALATGLVLTVNSRPFEGFAAIGFPLLFLLYKLVIRKTQLSEIRRHVLMPLLIVTICAGAMLYFNYRVTNNPFLMPHILSHTQYERTPLWHDKPLYPEPTYHNQQMKDFWTIEDVTRFKKLQTLPGYLDALQTEVIFGYFSLFIGPWMLPLAVASIMSVKDKKIRTLWLSIGAISLTIAGELYLHYFERHYLGPITAPTYVLMVQGLRHLRVLKLRNKRVGLALSRVILSAMLIGFIISLLAMPTVHQGVVRAQATLAGPRAKMMEQLSATPGKHLVIVHYAPGHDPGFEWVYNGADIDNAKVVWARDFAEENKKLFDYFPDRQVWVLDADSRPPRLYTLQESKSAHLSTTYPDQWTW